MFKQYLEENLKDYHYRLKTIVPINDTGMDRIESVLRKYDVKDISKVRKTQLQEHPLEFYNETNKEVFIVDVTLGMPISSQILHQELTHALETYEGAVVVRADNEPIEMYTVELNNAGKDDKKPLMSTEPESGDTRIEEEPLYGDTHNEKFLSRIARAKLTIDSEVIPDNAEFNKNHDGVRPHYGKPDTTDSNMPDTGNFDDDRKSKDGIR